MFNFIKSPLIIGVLGLSLISCQTHHDDPVEAHKARRVRNATLIGAGSGALVGALAGGSGSGRIVGAGIGALAGGALGAGVAKTTEK